MSDSLITKKRFAPLFITQALAAFNDNFLKNTLVFLILLQVGQAGLESSHGAALISLAGAIFMSPFLLLSALGGELADKFDKAAVARKLKLAEIFAALIAVAGIHFQSVGILMFALFLFGAGSALFGPLKYGILPDLMHRRELALANAWIEGATFAAILGGTIVAGLTSAFGGTDIWTFGSMMLGLAVACYAASTFIPSTSRADPDLRIDANIFRSTWKLVSELKTDKRLMTTALMSAWFWLVGAIALSILPSLVKEGFGGNETVITVYLTIFAVAVAVGSAVSAWMMAGRIALLPAPIGAFFAGIFALDLAKTAMSAGAVTSSLSLASFFEQTGSWRIAFDLIGMAFFGAMIVVPTFSALQAWAPERNRARIVAAANIISAGLMTVGGGLVALGQSLGATTSTVMFSLAALSVIASIAMFKALPTSPFRDFITILFRAFHRLEVEGLENLEKAGNSPILALNHVSFLDGPLALALTDREPVFAINKDIAQRWWVKPFLKVCKAMPLDPANPMATRTLIKSVRDGSPLVIFPEGRITITGALMKVYDGAAMVADKTGEWIVPIRIEGLESSFFSRLTSIQVKKKLFPKIKVTILEPVKLNVDEKIVGRKRRSAAGAELYKIMSDLVFRTSTKEETVIESVIRAGKTFGMNKVALQDPVDGTLSYGKMLTGVSVLGRKLASRFPNEDALGVMLPNANRAVLSVLAVMSAGKAPAMINFTAGIANILASCKAADLKTVLTSKAFIEKAKLEDIVDEMSKHMSIVYLDEVKDTVTGIDKALGFLTKTRVLFKKHIDDTAIILFTSGSEGTPKGVVLTNRNVLANTIQAGARIDFNTQDKVFNVLPMFHSFGLTAGTILPLTSGVPVYLYPSPLHYRIVPELVYGSNSTIIFGTDTFLSGYGKTAHAYDFRSLRYIFAGAEPVKAATRATYMEKFGKRILEGYGVTEAAPVVALNTPMFNKAGSVGKLLPGMEARLESIPGIEVGGRLFIKGPNIMKGYFRAENPGILDALVDGWHDTGDIVTIDEDGFITIVGRAKRFAKIAGEMISLAAVEVVAGKLWPTSLSAVAAVKDPRKGERLVLVTEEEKATKADFQKFAKECGLTELAIPSEIVIDKVPVLGSGKIDFVGVTKMVEARQ